MIAAGVVVLAGDASAAIEVRFSAAGDFSTTANTSTVLNGIDESTQDFFLALGDLSYGGPGSEASWCQYVKNRVTEGFPFELISGNHESNGQDGQINNFSACLPNQLPGVKGTYGREWFVDVPSAAPLMRMISISPGLEYPDGTWTYPAGSTRYNWVASAIDSARAANIPFVVVAMHKPCLSVGNYTCESGSDLMNLLINRRVDLVLSGHEHMYARTKQLRNGTGCTTLAPGSYVPACVADDDNDFAAGAGTVFAVVGTGGTAQYNANPGDSESQYFSIIQGASNPAWGLLDVRVTEDTLSAGFVRTAGASLNDQFVVRRGVGPPPDTTPPTAASGLTAAPAGAGAVQLGWAAATDDVGVTAYDVHRSSSPGFTPSPGNKVGETPSLSLSDVPGVGTWYYRVVSRDAAGNLGPASNEATATVSSQPVVLSSTPTADTYANQSAATANLGTSASLASRGTQGYTSYLRFALPPAPSGKALTSAVLRVRTTSETFAGSLDAHQVRLSPNTWGETTLTWNNRPTLGAAVLGTMATGTTPNQTVDVTLDVGALQPLLGADASLGVTSTGTDNVWFYSRNAATNRPQLILTFS